MDSLTGAVASQRVTEARKGRLRRVSDPLWSAWAQAGFTVTPTGGTDGKPGPSDPVDLRGKAIDHRIKVTPGITG